MRDGAEHKERDRATALARIALAAGLVSIALSIVYGHFAAAGSRAVMMHADWQGYAFWADTAGLGAFCTAALAIGLSVVAQVVRWRAPLPSGLGCLSLAVAIFALLLSFVQV